MSLRPKVNPRQTKQQKKDAKRAYIDRPEDFFKLSRMEWVEMAQRGPCPFTVAQQSYRGWLFIPLLMKNENENYGCEGGLLYISPNKSRGKSHGFSVGVLSPDDDDRALTFTQDERTIRPSAIWVLCRMNRVSVSFSDFLVELQSKLGGRGKLE